MCINSQPVPRLRAAIRNYVLNRSDSHPISIADMTRRIRYIMPETTWTDEELSELIAQALIEAGGNVAFDTRAKQGILTAKG
ncbi:hypothetical protein [Chelativorans sp.]|uniref:hypothetical protein n=1 Tax=Chelativorans sp. TaxID=2203393 RepID=UPI002811D7EF|nr:hypothetical protein [Chelativorans sp.]